MSRASALCFCVLLNCPNVSTAQTLIKCGASFGHGHFFAHETWNPDGASWSEDAISSGSIRLTLSGDQFDIEFGDAVGGSSYIGDGAQVIRLASNDDFLTIGAFHANYSDIYTFDLNNNSVAWSSHKIGLIPKAATYAADCSGS